jgi:hypothetical protein
MSVKKLSIKKIKMVKGGTGVGQSTGCTATSPAKCGNGLM